MNSNEPENEGELLELNLLAQKKWTRKSQRIASVLWPSFCVAAISTLLFFSFMDPELLGLALMPEREISALTGYGFSFFFFWLVGLMSSGMTMYLRRTRRREDSEERGDDEPRGH
jgi:hypothetical protein